MDPAEFQIQPLGLSHWHTMVLIALLTLAMFALVLIVAKRRGILCVGGKFRPLRYIRMQLRENRSTIMATVNKDLVGRYNNCYFGVLWNIMFPLLLVCAIYVIFIGVKNVYPDREYWTYICSGLFIAAFCRQALGGYSLRGNSAVVRKLPNPAWSIVLADTISKFISCIVPFAILLTFMTIHGVSLDLTSFGYVLLMLGVLFVFCLGLTMMTSILTVLAGDLKQIISTIGRLMVWVSPIFFYICDCTDALYKLVMWNPFTYFVEPFHQAISYGITPDPVIVETAVLCALFFTMIGFVLYLWKADRIRELI